MTVSQISYLNNAYRSLYINRTNTSNSIQKLASGYRINRSSDDAAGLAVSEAMRGQISGLSMASRNAQDAVSMVQTAEGGLSKLSDSLVRMRELAVQASNGTYSDADRALLSKEFDQLKGHMDQVVSSTNYNGTKLLDGTLDETTGKNAVFQIGANGSADQRMSLGIGDMSVSALGLENISISSLSGANSAIEAIDKAVGSVNSQRSNLGAAQNRLEHAVNSLNVSRENLAKSESRIRDLDMAWEMIRYTQNSIQMQSSQAMLAQGMNLSRMNMIGLLLR